MYEPEGAESHKHLDGSVVEINSTPFTEEQESKERTDSNRVNGGRDGGRCEEAAVRFMVGLNSSSILGGFWRLPGLSVSVQRVQKKKEEDGKVIR